MGKDIVAATTRPGTAATPPLKGRVPLFPRLAPGWFPRGAQDGSIGCAQSRGAQHAETAGSGVSLVFSGGGPARERGEVEMPLGQCLLRGR